MILVTGGTGLVGSHLLLHLVKMDSPIRAIYRNPDKLGLVRRVFSYYVPNPDELLKKIEWVAGDINDIPTMEMVFEGIDQVYHCAALISFDPDKLPELVQVNEVGTENMVNLSISKQISKFCYVSSIAAIGKPEDQIWLSEDTEWKNVLSNPYALTKHLAEMEVWRASQEGVPVVIVNPGVIIGPGFWDSGSGALFKTASKGPRFYPPGGSGFVAVEDVVQLMIKLMKSEIVNERFVVVSENLSYQEILKRITDQLGKKPAKKELSLVLLKILWRIDWLLAFVFGRKRRLSKAQVHSLQNRCYYKNDKAINMIGFEYGSLDKAIEFSSAKFKEENPAFSS